MRNTYKWVADHFAFWQKICRANHQAFRNDELGKVFQALLKLAKKNPDFGIILIVFLTEYENEFPIFRSSNTP